jgi:ankyrin repeat protein
VQGGSLEVLGFLISKGVDPKIKDAFDRSVLHMAALAGYVDMVTFLIEKKHDDRVNTKSKFGIMLIEAAEEGNWDVVKVLVEKGADVKVKTDVQTIEEFGYKDDDIELPPSTYREGGGLTVLHYAARDGRLDMVKLLVQKGADVNAQMDMDQMMGGETVLHYAVCSGSVEVVKFLVEAGARVEVKDTYGSTSFRTAVVCCYRDIIAFLLEQGADPAPEPVHGETLMDIARAYCKQDVIELLESKGAK